MTLERATTIGRDVAIWSAGIYGIVHQELTGRVHLELLVLYMAVLAIPGGIGLFQLVKAGTLPTPDSPSQSADSQSSGQQSWRQPGDE